MDHLAKKDLEEEIIMVIKTIYDPEIPVDIYELGLIYHIKIDDEVNVKILDVYRHIHSNYYGGGESIYNTTKI